MAGVCELQFRTRGANPHDPIGNGLDEQSSLGGRGGDLLVAQALPLAAELVRLGKSWYGISSNNQTTNVIPVGSNQPAWALWNSATPGMSKTCLVIDSISVATPTIAQAILGLSTWLLIDQNLPAAWPLVTQVLANQIESRSLQGRREAGSATSALAVKSQSVGYLFTPTTGSSSTKVWFPFGKSTHKGSASGNSMLTQEVAIDGRIILPPNAWIECLYGVNVATTATTQFSVRWHEINLDCG